MVLNENPGLEVFGISSAHVEDAKNRGEFYGFLNKRRNDKFEKNYASSISYAVDIRAEHLESLAFVETLIRAGDAAVLEGTLVKYNTCMVTEVEPQRVLVLMDATCSMGDLIDKAKMSVKVTFERVQTTLDDEGLDGSFQAQFGVYRNYNVREDKLLEFSTWEAAPSSLRTFIDGIRVTGPHLFRQSVLILILEDI